MADHEPTEPTRRRLGDRSRQLLFALGATTILVFLRTLVKGRSPAASMVTAAAVVGGALVAAVAIYGVYQLVDRRRTADDPTALYVGRASLYIDQMRQAPDVAGAATDARVRWLRFLTQGQGIVEGMVRLDHWQLQWTPMRIGRRCRVEPWAVGVEKVERIEISRGHIPVGAGGVVTLQLRSGHVLDAIVSDRHRFGQAWTQATDPARRPPGPAPTPALRPHHRPQKLCWWQRVVLVACWPAAVVLFEILDRVAPPETRSPGWIHAVSGVWLLGLLLSMIVAVAGRTEAPAVVFTAASYGIGLSITEWLVSPSSMSTTSFVGCLIVFGSIAAIASAIGMHPHLARAHGGTDT